MSLAKKLNLKDGMKVRVVGRPADVDLDDVTTARSGGDAVLVFVKTMAEVERNAKPAIDAAKNDLVAWIAYPKAGQLGTDLNRDILWKRLQNEGIQGVRQIAIDDTWSAMRFRPT
jgi:hypothetical protein